MQNKGTIAEKKGWVGEKLYFSVISYLENTQVGVWIGENAETAKGHSWGKKKSRGNE